MHAAVKKLFAFTVANPHAGAKLLALYYWFTIGTPDSRVRIFGTVFATYGHDYSHDYGHVRTVLVDGIADSTGECPAFGACGPPEETNRERLLDRGFH